MRAAETPAAEDGPVRADIRAMRAYPVPDDAGLVKLDAMENPHRLPDDLAGEIAAAVAGLSLNRYPDPSARRLRELIRDRHSVPETHEVILGNGSDELIQVLTQACCGGPGGPQGVVMGLDPGFVMYERTAKVCGAQWHAASLGDGFDIDLDETLGLIGELRPRLFFAASPNNPTGNALSAERLDRIADAMEPSGWLVVDEAYQAFSGLPSLLGRYAGRPNVLVMGTLSKLGLAGIRLGHLVGRKAQVAHLEKVRLPYNVNACTQAVAHAVLGRFDAIRRQIDLIVSERERLREALNALPGVRAHPSRANFLLVEVPSAEAAWSGLVRRGVLVRKIPGPVLGKSDRHLRVTVGTEDDNRALVDAFRATQESQA